MKMSIPNSVGDLKIFWRNTTLRPGFRINCMVTCHITKTSNYLIKK